METFIVFLTQGFGNKMFNLIIGMYINQINGGKLLIRIKKSKHENITDPTIDQLFPKLKHYYEIVKSSEEMRELYELNYDEFDSRTIQNIEGFKLMKKNLIMRHHFSQCYKYIFKMFTKLKIKEIFEMEKSFLNKETLTIAKEKYLCVHIRYGDKLFYALGKLKYKFIVYTPQFYKYIIRKFMDYNKYGKIYIITDDVKIVNEFILDDIKSENIKIIDENWWNSFYILNNATQCILSMSTFSFIACLTNKKDYKAYIVMRPKEIDKFKIPEEEIINDTHWFKKYDKKYILNFDTKLVKKMLPYSSKNFDYVKTTF